MLNLQHLPGVLGKEGKWKRQLWLKLLVTWIACDLSYLSSVDPLMEASTSSCLIFQNPGRAPSQGEPDAGEPDAGEPDAGEPDAG